MKMKQSVNRIWRTLSVVLPALLLVFGPTACDPKEANAVHVLVGLLNSPEGQDMSADELANISRTSGQKIRCSGAEVHLPITNTDTRPVNGADYKADDGTTLRFTLGDGPDTLRTIATVDVEWHQNEWGHSFAPEKEPVYMSYNVQSRGKGIYTFWYMQEQYEAGHPIIDEQGDTLRAPFFEGMLVFVYPGADSILISRGHPDTEHTYSVKNGK
jgi:hypothetical protein